MINGEPATERALASLIYSVEHYPSRDELVDMVTTHSVDRLGATSVKVLNAETFE